MLSTKPVSNCRVAVSRPRGTRVRATYNPNTPGGYPSYQSAPPQGYLPPASPTTPAAFSTVESLIAQQYRPADSKWQTIEDGVHVRFPTKVNSSPSARLVSAYISLFSFFRGAFLKVCF